MSINENAKNNSLNFRCIVEKDKCIWENCDLRLVFSNPDIQAFDDYAFVKSLNNVLYYYYTVSIYRKISKYDYNEDKLLKEDWLLVSEMNSYDFPTIEQLQYMLNALLNDNIPLEEYQKCIYYTHDNKGNSVPSGKIEYKYSLESSGFEAEDFYEITRILICDESLSSVVSKQTSIKKENIERFNIYIGTSIDATKPFTNLGVRYSSITREDLSKLLECVNNFIQLSINIYNANVIKSNKLITESFICKNNLLFEMNKEEENVIESIFTPGNFCDIAVLIGENGSENMHSLEYANTTIKEISKEKIIISGGYYNDCDEAIKIKELEIPLNTILYICNNLDDEKPVNKKSKLCYNEDEIFEDFLSLFDDELKQEFKNTDVDVLFKRWKSPIINRTWMCRTEHKFHTYVDNKNNANIYYIVKKIIVKIKDYLK